MTSFLSDPEPSAQVQRLYDDDLAGDGFVMNLTRVWAHDPDGHDRFSGLLGHLARDLTFRQKGILVSATASTLGDSYCSLAWGKRLADEVGPAAAVGVLNGDDTALDPAEQALARWARTIVRDPNTTGPDDIAALRDAGFDDDQIFALTAYVALRGAFSTVNDALGARPDTELADMAPAEVRDAITWGRPAG
jgi:alkylhydroperoxidase family enzyme